MDNALPTGLLMLRVIPYFLPLTIVLILFAAFPQISLWLPDLVMRPQQRWNAFARTLQRLIGADGVVEQDERESLS